MNENHKSIDSYFESARNFKTPISRDYARSLLEKKGLNINKPISFFSKKGVKTMTIISSIIIATLIGWFGLGNNISEQAGQASKQKKNNNSISSQQNFT